MRTRCLASFSSILLSSAALAAPPPVPAPRPAAPPPVPALPGFDTQSVPAACKSFVAPAQAANRQVAVPARLSLASCMATQAVAPITLCDCGQSIVDVDQAVAPAVAILDGVISAGGVVSQALAAHAKGELYAGFVMRLTAAVPKLSPSATPQEMALHDLRAQALDPQLAPWRDTARAAFTQVLELAKSHPEIGKHAGAATAIRDSQQRMAADVALREAAPAKPAATASDGKPDDADGKPADAKPDDAKPDDARPDRAL